MKTRSLICLTMSLALGGFVRAHPAPIVDSTEEVEQVAGHGWIAEESDNIAGIRDLKKVTKPAVVNYETLLSATPQMKELDRRGIDPDSPEGKALRNGARTLITKTCQIVRRAKGHCSVWKVIAHKDGRSIPNVTYDVIDRF